MRKKDITVKELINVLKNLNPDSIVRVTSEGTYASLTQFVDCCTENDKSVVYILNTYDYNLRLR